jgi:hypothetical protein
MDEAESAAVQCRCDSAGEKSSQLGYRDTLIKVRCLETVVLVCGSVIEQWGGTESVDHIRKHMLWKTVEMQCTPASASGPLLSWMTICLVRGGPKRDTSSFGSKSMVRTTENSCQSMSIIASRSRSFSAFISSTSLSFTRVHSNRCKHLHTMHIEAHPLNNGS